MAGNLLPESNPENPKPKSKGGPDTHKPGCKCVACKSRRRKAEAFALAARGGGNDVDSPKDVTEVLEAEYPKGIPVSKTSVKSRVAEWLRLRALHPDISIKETAEQLGISSRTLSRAITQATQEGWLRFEDPFDRIDYQLIPKTLRNLNEFLDDRDKNVTIEMAKGTIFKTYQDSKIAHSQPQVVLALKFEQPEGESVNIIAGHVVGTPKGSKEDKDAVG